MISSAPIPLPVIAPRRPAAPTADAAERPGYPVPEAKRVGPLWEALREVMDPEIPISLVDLGLIYDLRLEGTTARVDLTFTATACPCMAFIRFDIEERLLREAGVQEVEVREVWNPAWTKARITERGRQQLKQLGVAM